MDPPSALEDGGAVGAVGGDHGTDRHAGDFIFLPSVDGLGRLVPALDLPFGADTDDGVGDVRHQAGPVAVGRFGLPPLGDVPGDELVRGLPGPGGADAGDLHDDGRPVRDHAPDLAVLEELPRLGELGQALGHGRDIAGVHEVGDGPAVVLGERLGVLLLRLGADQSPSGTVAVDEQPVLVDQHHIGGDLGEQAVAIDQLAEFPLETLLGGHIDHDAGVEGHGPVGGRCRPIARSVHGRGSDHHMVIHPIGAVDGHPELELSRRYTGPHRSEDRRQQELAGVSAIGEPGLGRRVLRVGDLFGSGDDAVDAEGVVPGHGESPDALLEAEELLDRRRPDDGVLGYVINPGHRPELLRPELDAVGQLEDAVAER